MANIITKTCPLCSYGLSTSIKRTSNNLTLPHHIENDELVFFSTFSDGYPMSKNKHFKIETRINRETNHFSIEFKKEPNQSLETIAIVIANKFIEFSHKSPIHLLRSCSSCHNYQSRQNLFFDFTSARIDTGPWIENFFLARPLDEKSSKIYYLENTNQQGFVAHIGIMEKLDIESFSFGFAHQERWEKKLPICLSMDYPFPEYSTEELMERLDVLSFFA